MYAHAPSTVIEIGPGKGALTELLIERGAAVHAIEVDPAMGEILRARFAGASNFHLTMADVLDVDLSQWGEAALAGNLPYYITSPILDRIFAARRVIRRAVILVQLEVAHRLVARPGTRDYGYLSVVAQTQAEVRLVCRVPASAFRPPPKVESAVVSMELKAGDDPELDGFLAFAALAFRQKRKTLRNNLMSRYPRAAKAGFAELQKRAEQLSIAELRALWKRLEGAESGDIEPGLVS